MLPFCTAAANPPPAAGLPDWLLGTWDTSEVLQSTTARYVPYDGPEVWYAGKMLTITRDRLSFADRVCLQFTVHAVRGPLRRPVMDIDGVEPESFGLPHERSPIDYLEVRCAKNLVDLGDGQGVTHEMNDPLTWYIVLRSHTKIEMPFFGHAYVKLRRPAATS